MIEQTLNLDMDKMSSIFLARAIVFHRRKTLPLTRQCHDHCMHMKVRHCCLKPTTPWAVDLFCAKMNLNKPKQAEEQQAIEVPYPFSAAAAELVATCVKSTV